MCRTALLILGSATLIAAGVQLPIDFAEWRSAAQQIEKLLPLTEDEIRDTFTNDRFLQQTRATAEELGPLFERRVFNQEILNWHVASKLLFMGLRRRFADGSKNEEHARRMRNLRWISDELNFSEYNFYWPLDYLKRLVYSLRDVDTARQSDVWKVDDDPFNGVKEALIELSRLAGNVSTLGNKAQMTEDQKKTARAITWQVVARVVVTWHRNIPEMTYRGPGHASAA